MLLALLEVVPGAATGEDRIDDPVLVDQLAVVARGLGLDLTVTRMSTATVGFAQVVSLVTLELGGHFVGGFEPADALVEHALQDLADRLGLP